MRRLRQTSRTELAYLKLLQCTREVVLVARDDGDVRATLREQDGKTQTKASRTTRDVAVLIIRQLAL